MQGCSCDGVNVTRGVEKLRGRFGAAISVLPSMLLPFIVPNRVHYGALADYHSYDLAWLGPIAFPLLCAICAQGFIYADMLLGRSEEMVLVVRNHPLLLMRPC